MGHAVNIRQLGREDATAFQELRLEGLKLCPEAFGSTFEEEITFTQDQILARFAGSPDDFILGAFEGETLIGVIGFQRPTRIKRRHGAHIWGFFVTPSARGKGIGAALLAELIRRARQIEGLEQIGLSVVTQCVDARRLYLAHGFESYGVEPRAHKHRGVWFDMDHMILRFA